MTRSWAARPPVAVGSAVCPLEQARARRVAHRPRRCRLPAGASLWQLGCGPGGSPLSLPPLSVPSPSFPLGLLFSCSSSALLLLPLPSLAFSLFLLPFPWSLSSLVSSLLVLFSLCPWLGLGLLARAPSWVLRLLRAAAPGVCFADTFWSRPPGGLESAFGPRGVLGSCARRNTDPWCGGPPWSPVHFCRLRPACGGVLPSGPASAAPPCPCCSAAWAGWFCVVSLSFFWFLVGRLVVVRFRDLNCMVLIA